MDEFVSASDGEGEDVVLFDEISANNFFDVIDIWRGFFLVLGDFDLISVNGEMDREDHARLSLLES